MGSGGEFALITAPIEAFDSSRRRLLKLLFVRPARVLQLVLKGGAFVIERGHRCNACLAST